MSFQWNKKFASPRVTRLPPSPITTAEEDEKDESLNEPLNDKLEYGFIAQEVEEIFPDLVHTDESSGYKSIKYHGVTPMLVEAVKDHDERHRTFAQRVKSLREQLQDRDSRLLALKPRIEALHRRLKVYQRVAPSRL